MQNKENKKKNIKHGMHGTPEYNAWRNMKARCYKKHINIIIDMVVEE